MALAQAQKVEEIWVFEDLSRAAAQGFDRLSPNGCGSLNGGGGLQAGEFGALEGFAFILLAQFAHAPGLCCCLLGVELACLLGFER